LLGCPGDVGRLELADERSSGWPILRRICEGWDGNQAEADGAVGIGIGLRVCGSCTGTQRREKASGPRTEGARKTRATANRRATPTGARGKVFRVPHPSLGLRRVGWQATPVSYLAPDSAEACATGQFFFSQAAAAAPAAAAAVASRPARKQTSRRRHFMMSSAVISPSGVPSLVVMRTVRPFTSEHGAILPTLMCT
jgi:hypothetical protein